VTKRSRAGLTDKEFNALVDNEFKKPTKRKKRTAESYGAWVPPDSLVKQLEKEGASEGLSPSAARFNGVMGRIFGGGQQRQLSPESTAFIQEFDAKARAFAKAHGIELRDDE
jgi:hypothetical protein